MDINFLPAKNGEMTCEINKVFLHSKYNPSSEVNRWIEGSISSINYKVSKVIVIFPCIPYCKDILAKNFPDAELIFFQTDSCFNNNINKSIKTFLVTGATDETALSENLYNHLGEECSNSILFLEWKPAVNLFREEYKIALNSIKGYMEKSKNVIATRGYFSKKWFLNSIRFFSNAKNICILNSIEKDILICASGPTLTESIPYIKKYRNHFFLLAVSSSLSVLEHNSITADAVISTDGGYWAKKHIETSKKKYCFPIIASSESAIPYSLFNENIFFPLNYGDYINKELFELAGFPSVKNNRNGSVSGNAVELALSLTEKNVYTAGLDLCMNKGYAHAQPNRLEISNSITDTKISNTETRTVKANQNARSLEIYRNWFETLPESKARRIFRLCKNNCLQNLGMIKTLNWEKTTFSSKKDGKINIEFYTAPQNARENLKIHITKELEKLSNAENLENCSCSTIQYLENFALGDVILYNKFGESSSFKKAKEKTICILKKALEVIDR